jgi:hypothetical protein
MALGQHRGNHLPVDGVRDLKAEFEPEGLEFIPATNQLVVSNPGVGSVSLINLTQP